MNKRKIITEVIGLIGVVIVYLILHSYLANSDIVSSILAAGGHIPIFKLALAVIFIVLRLFIIAVLPGYILARITYELALSKLQKVPNES
jgi:uncharacterized membrane protein YbhN (UPF0104 family)